MTNPIDWLLWNLRGRPRISIRKKLFAKLLFEEGLPVLDSVPAYKYSEYMAELNRRAWQLLEQRAFKPMSAVRQKAVIAAGRRRLKKQRALVADLHMKVLANRGSEIDQLDRVIETKLKLIEMMSSQIAELKTERGALLAEQKRVQQKCTFTKSARARINAVLI
jgi:hypothetical protein